MCVISLKITKNNGADSKKFAVKVHRVEAEIEEFNVEQLEAEVILILNPAKAVAVS